LKIVSTALVSNALERPDTDAVVKGNRDRPFLASFGMRLLQDRVVTARSIVAIAERLEHGNDFSAPKNPVMPARISKSLMDAPTVSIRDLADRLDRDVRQVHDDLQVLTEYRIVHFEENGSAKQPNIPYETISIEVELSKSVGNTSESPAPV
jgi:hypothetical protein